MKTTFVTRFRVIPIGDKEERNRVYQYYRDAQYNQYKALNQIMSLIGVVYYNCGRNTKSDEFKEQYKAIFKRNSVAFDGVDFPKGSQMQGCVSRKAQSDFSAALKNGLAKGERQLPRYKRDFPFMISGAQLKPYIDTEEYEGKEKKIYCFKSVNKIALKVVLGAATWKDYRKVDLLDKLVGHDERYKLCQSNIFFKNNKMFLDLVVTKEVEIGENIVERRTMGVACGFNQPIHVAFNDMDDTYSLGDGEHFVEQRREMQENYRKLIASLRDTTGGHGRPRKLKALERRKSQEKNFARSYNHKLSKDIVEIAEKNGVERIILQEIDAEQVRKNPIMLRNWSFYQLYSFIEYKAKNKGIQTETEKTQDVCPECGCLLELKANDETDMDNTYIESCPECGEKIDIGRNRARYLAKIEKKASTKKNKKQ